MRYFWHTVYPILTYFTSVFLSLPEITRRYRWDFLKITLRLWLNVTPIPALVDRKQTMAEMGQWRWVGIYQCQFQQCESPFKPKFILFHIYIIDNNEDTIYLRINKTPVMLHRCPPTPHCSWVSLCLDCWWSILIFISECKCRKIDVTASLEPYLCLYLY